nr:alpha/beta hydrolase [uncultured Enterobacter sp.]
MSFPGGKRGACCSVVLLVVLACGYVLHRVANAAFFYPNDTVYGPMPVFAESVTFNAKDGTRLHGWFIPSATGPAGRATATVIHAHGNAGNMSAHWPLVSWLPQRNVNLFMFDYRGYGQSQGSPSQAGLCDDTQSAIAYVRQRSDVDPQRLVLLGQSLGGNNVLAAFGQETQTPGRSGIRAIILDSTFSSYSAIASDVVPGSGILLNNRYSADRYIAAVSPIPVLIIHGKADRVIPWQHSETLYRLAGQPKQAILIPDGEHIDAFSKRHGTRYQDAALRFIQNALQDTAH